MLTTAVARGMAISVDMPVPRRLSAMWLATDSWFEAEGQEAVAVLIGRRTGDIRINARYGRHEFEF